MSAYGNMKAAFTNTDFSTPQRMEDLNIPPV